jgi:hypothetical protein
MGWFDLSPSDWNDGCVLGIMRYMDIPLKFTFLTAVFVMAVSPLTAYAQGVHRYSNSDATEGGNAVSTGAPVYSGTAVPTGRGPPSDPLPPAAILYGGRILGRGATPINPRH